MFGIGGEIVRTGLTQKIETRERLNKDRDGLGIVKLNLTGKEELYAIIAEEHGVRSDPSWWGFSEPEVIWKTTLQEVITVKQPSKEQIAAEQSVAKAKEALKAAEKTLKAVKEGK
jgi:hypothetical protein